MASMRLSSDRNRRKLSARVVMPIATLPPVLRTATETIPAP